jgi:hypothetical protein
VEKMVKSPSITLHEEKPSSGMYLGDSQSEAWSGHQLFWERVFFLWYLETGITSSFHMCPIYHSLNISLFSTEQSELLRESLNESQSKWKYRRKNISLFH